MSARAKYFTHGLLCWSALLGLSACSEKPLPAWSGYAEGDYLYIAAPLAGRLDVLSIESGQKVEKGAPLFALDAEVEQAARAEALAREAAARAQAANTEKGRRSDELAVTEAQLAQATTQATLARSDL